ncbi:twin-arginine translocase TatA/TatE family subunit [Pontibacter sp. E15-1]|uniref:Sec-independent protein translocase subunit TatA/TatB n=1 Tax=Pontibacter sp. E15-1 TaxID=2919918 RepID=UPI001F4F92E4|nr:twin-arginine translocase TatA/TatE family subunit [Pontibacter sp. E15-1]MCJ8166228.1 twin-arginine translocase TatA/TatE family subunit [Pontibacter sp. E15-1]
MELNNILVFIGGLGGTEVIIILIAVLLLFGAKRIPELAKGLGRGIREFKDATNEIKNDIENPKREEPKPAAKTYTADTTAEKAAL